MRRNIVYPEKAAANHIQGKVVVRFEVDTDGNVTNPEVLSSVHPLLDGVAVNTWYIVPITFRLTGDATSAGQKRSIGRDQQTEETTLKRHSPRGS